MAPAVTVVFAGFVVTTGPAVTVKVAAVVVAEPALLVNTARYWLPFCAAAAVKDNVVDVAPATLVKVTPPSALTCHCTVGVGFPLAAAVKVAVELAAALILTGLVVVVGAKFTVNIAAVVVAVPEVLVNTARYKFPF